jgi:hypothetical protein
MPVFNILLAEDISRYGSIAVEAETWEEAVRQLTDESWDSHCIDPDDTGTERRIVHVEDGDGDGDGYGAILAEDISFDCSMVHYLSVVARLTDILDRPDGYMAESIEAYIDELRTMVRDPIFNKEDR